MFYESQPLRARAQPDGLAGEYARRQSQHPQPERADSSQILRFVARGSADEIDTRLRDLVAMMARGIVDRPDAVRVEIIEPGTDALLELSVDPDDLGHVIGRQGRTARALRQALGAAAAKQDRQAGLEIAD